MKIVRENLALLVGPGAFRLALAFMVFVAHSSPLYIGRLAVMAFFILSGYWVSRLLSNWEGTTLQFWTSRALRLWPVLIAVVAIQGCLFGVFNLPLDGDWLSTIALLGLTLRNDASLTVAWSLDIEMQFYLLLPALLWVITIGKEERVGGYILALVATVVTAAGFVWFAHGIDNVFMFLPMFIAGMWLQMTDWRATSKFATLSVVTTGGIVALLVLIPVTRDIFISNKSHLHAWWHTLVYEGVALLLLPFIAWNVHQASSRTDKMLGEFTYPFYLVHMLMIHFVVNEFGVSGVSKIGSFVLALGVAWVVYRVVDRPIEKWRTALWRKPNQPHRQLQTA